MKVQDLMHHGAVCVDDDTPVREVARIMRDEDVGCVLVSAAGELVGIVTDRDIVCRGLADGIETASAPVRQLMSKNPLHCAPDDDIDEALETMEAHHIRRLAVIDDEALVGVLALGDLTRHMGDRRSGEVLRHVATHHA